MNECCKDRDNRFEIQSPREDLTTEQCVICLRKHYRMRVDPGFFIGLFGDTSDAAE